MKFYHKLLRMMLIALPIGVRACNPGDAMPCATKNATISVHALGALKTATATGESIHPH